MSGTHATNEVQADVVETIESLNRRTGISRRQLLSWADIVPSRYNRWRALSRSGDVVKVVRQRCATQILPEEHAAIVEFRKGVIKEGRTLGYRFQAYEMLDRDIAAVSESVVYRTLKEEGLLSTRESHPTRKGTGFVQPLRVHDHWHTDISYLYEFGYRAYLISVLDGCSRAVLHHKVRRSMTSGDVELVLQTAMEKYPAAKPRLITDNGGQFVSYQFKQFLAEAGFTHRRTAANYPQSNGKMERQFRTTKEMLRQQSIVDFQDLEDGIDQNIYTYNYERYHSAIGYVAPMDVVLNRAESILLARQQKLDAARKYRILVNNNILYSDHTVNLIKSNSVLSYLT